MPSNAFSGVGTLFRRWNSTTSEWENIAEVNSITGPGMTKDFIDVTSLDSTGGYREYITGFRDGGNVSLSMNMTRITWDLMLADFESDDLQHYNIVLPDNENTSISFAGLVTEMPLTIPTDDKVTMDVTIKVSGMPTTDSGASSGI
jgi:predicted secreted protein